MGPLKGGLKNALDSLNELYGGVRGSPQVRPKRPPPQIGQVNAAVRQTGRSKKSQSQRWR
jgi:hypothetical protein